MWKGVGLAAVFLIKLAVLLQLKDHPLLQVDAGLDTTAYVDLGHRVLAGNVLLAPGLYFVSPLYIYFLAAMLGATESITAARLAQAVFGTAAVAFIFIAAREWFGDRAAWFSAALAAVTGLFTFYETLILQAAIDPFLTAAALCTLTFALTRASPRSYLLAGVLFGLQSLNRPNILMAAGGIGLLLLAMQRPRRQGVRFFAGLLIALAPVMIRNVIVAGDWSPGASHGGLNFYIGNNPEADGTYHSVPGITPNILGQQDDARRVAEQATGHSLNDTEVSGYFYRKGLAWVVSEPVAALRLFLRKLFYTLSAAHLSLNYSYPFFAGDSQSLLRLLIVGPWLLIPLGLTGLAVPVEPSTRSRYLIWVSFVPLYAISVAAFFAAERYRLPLLTPLCIGAGQALSSIAAAIQQRDWRRVVIRAAALIAIALAVNWPLGLDDGRAEATVRMAERLIDRERFDEAERWATKAVERNPTPGIVHFRVGRAYSARGRSDSALVHLREASRLDPDRTETSFALGQALLDAGRATEAIPQLRRAFDAGVRPDLSGFDLARALASTGDQQQAIQVLEKVRPARADDAGSWYAMGRFAGELGAHTLAARYFGEAARAAPDSANPREQLGLTLAALSDFEGAIRELERAKQIDPTNPRIHLNLAVALAGGGRVPEARTQVQEALRLDPRYEKARELLQVLEK